MLTPEKLEGLEGVLIREGMNIERANLEFHWGQLDIPEFNIQDVFKSIEIGIVSKERGESPKKYRQKFKPDQDASS